MIHWLWLSTLRHTPPARRRELLAHFGDAEGVFNATRRDLSRWEWKDEALHELLARDTREAESIARRCEEEDVHLITWQDAAYPQRLRNISDPPLLLYVKGKLPPVDEEVTVAIVGTRKSSPYGDKMARDLAYGVVKGGGIVVTGLAEGADAAAAQGALMAGGRVIGVLGTGITEIFPAFHRRLFEDVAAAGALVSEYPPGAHGTRSSFPQRNRIIAGLSLGVVVAEAPLRSGALITAHRALDYGRDVFAVPGNADATNSRGSNALLREGAMLAETAWDILSQYEAQFPDKVLLEGKPLAVPEELAVPARLREEPPEAPAKQEKAEKTPGLGFFKLRVPVRRGKTGDRPDAAALEAQLAGLSAQQLSIVGAMSAPSMHIDDIIEKTQLPAATVLAEMTLLQIKGFVAAEPGKCFTLKIAKRG